MIAPIATAEDHQRAMGALLLAVRDFTETWTVAPDHLLVGHRLWTLLAPMFQPVGGPTRQTSAGVASPVVQVFGIPILPTYLDPELVWGESHRIVVSGDRLRAVKFPATTRKDWSGRDVSTYAIQASLDRANWRPLTGNDGHQFHVELLGDREMVDGYWSPQQRGIVFDQLTEVSP